MDQSNLIPPGTQQIALYSLIFSKELGEFARNVIPKEVWAIDPAMLKLTERLYWYIDTYKDVPGQSIYGMIDMLQSVSDEDKELLTTMVASIESENPAKNQQYAKDCIVGFVRENLYKQALYDGLEHIKRGDIASIQDQFDSVRRADLKMFDRGLTLREGVHKLMLATPETMAEDRVYLDIESLDYRDLIPRRKEMYLFMAPAKYGKTWFLIYVGKQAIIQNKKVAHVTLELQDLETNIRYLQALWAHPTYKLSPQERLFFTQGGFTLDYGEDRPLLYDSLPEIDRKLLHDHYIEKNLRIKEFPTRALTINQLKGYLNDLEIQDKFIPDVLIVDYADLMRAGTTHRDSRLDLGQLYCDLRALATERNLILVTATQANRAAAKEQHTDAEGVSEDYSKIATADCVLAMSRTKEEKMIGTARLNVAAGRRGSLDYEILISQNFELGQFCIASKDMCPAVAPEYKTHLDAFKDKNRETIIVPRMAVKR